MQQDYITVIANLHLEDLLVIDFLFSAPPEHHPRPPAGLSEDGVQFPGGTVQSEPPHDVPV